VANLILHALTRNWWLLLVRGIVAICFGLLALFSPGLTLAALVIMYAVYAIADGVCAFAAAVASDAKTSSTWWLVIVGALGIAAGLFMLVRPGLTAIALVMLAGIWAILHGLVEIMAAIQLRKYIDNEWALIIGGLLSVLFGTFVFVRPGAGALALIWVIGIYAIAFGVLIVAFSFRLRAHRTVA
jgi:uncharacterized membrane protein HdeD (DUF308 family)